MQREILKFKRKKFINGCCPGHDDFPDETYKSRRSKKARSRDKRAEHQYARSLAKRDLHDNFEMLH